MTALVVAICFALSSFFSPLLAIVPSAATAPILIIVGIMMLSNLKTFLGMICQKLFQPSSHLSLWDSVTPLHKGLLL
ncbi:hypothetical protein GR255_24555, partial [Mycobacterium tuberculosis]|nr:hypothetical protein [Mycobacterium tuberculosis]